MPQHPGSLPPGTRLRDGYEIESLLGQGGFASVYLARQLRTGQRVALKVLRPGDPSEADAARAEAERVARFEREMRLVAVLNHPHIVRLIDRGQLDDGALFTALEFVQGQSLAEHIAADGPMAEAEAIEVMGQVLDALVCAHDEGVIHRDLKPGNIMLRSTGARRSALLLDFGLASVERGAVEDLGEHLTRKGDFMGTPAYCAPEQVRGEEPTPQVDLYAWGLVFLELLTGRRAFDGELRRVLSDQLSPSPVPIPPSLRESPLGRVIACATAKDPGRRYASARDAWADLMSCAAPRGGARARAGDDSFATDTWADPSMVEGVEAPLIGRHSEFGLLKERWQRARSGQGQAALIWGEAGIGKSHLIRALQRDVQAEAHGELLCACEAEDQDTPLRPLIDALRRAVFRPHEGGPAQDPLQQLRDFLRPIGLEPRSQALIAALLDVPWRGPSLLDGLTPTARLNATLEALADALAGLSEEHPLLLLIEDLHWADPTTLRLLALLQGDLAALPIFVLVTSREPAPEALASAAMLNLQLAPLPAQDTARLIDEIADRNQLSEAARAWLIEASDGVPLFAEELARAAAAGELVPDDSAPGGAAQSLPERLRATLVSRLEGAEEAREVAEVASTLGRSFTRGFLFAVWEGEVSLLEPALRKLVSRGLLWRRGRRASPRYVFRHHLIHDVAYASLGPARAERVHLSAAHHLEQEAPEIAETQPELIAHHFARGGDLLSAVRYTVAAAQRASRALAVSETLAQVSRGLSWMAQLPESEDLRRYELELRAHQAPAYFASEGYGSDLTEQTLSRAMDLSVELGGSEHDFTVRWGLWVCYTVQARHAEALPIARALADIAEQSGDEQLILEANNALGHSMYYLPELFEGVERLDRTLALYDPVAHANHAAAYGQDPGVMAAAFSAPMLFIRGEAAAGEARIAQSLRYAEAQGPPSVAMSRCLRTVLHQLRGEPEATRENAEDLIRFAQRAQLPFWAAIGRVYAAWAAHQLGRPATREIQEALTGYQATGSSNNLIAYLIMTADVEAAEGAPEQALLRLEEAERRSLRSGERRMLAEVYRLRARVLFDWSAGQRRAARHYCERAAEVAREQGALSFGLRAALLRVELTEGQPDHPEALAELRRILDAMGPGDTPDLRRAAALGLLP